MPPATSSRYYNQKDRKNQVAPYAVTPESDESSSLRRQSDSEPQRKSKIIRGAKAKKTNRSRDLPLPLATSSRRSSSPSTPTPTESAPSTTLSAKRTLEIVEEDLVPSSQVSDVDSVKEAKDEGRKSRTHKPVSTKQVVVSRRRTINSSVNTAIDAPSDPKCLREDYDAPIASSSSMAPGRSRSGEAEHSPEVRTKSRRQQKPDSPYYRHPKKTTDTEELSTPTSNGRRTRSKAMSSAAIPAPAPAPASAPARTVETPASRKHKSKPSKATESEAVSISSSTPAPSSPPSSVKAISSGRSKRSCSYAVDLATSSTAHAPSPSKRLRQSTSSSAVVSRASRTSATASTRKSSKKSSPQLSLASPSTSSPSPSVAPSSSPTDGTSTSSALVLYKAAPPAEVESESESDSESESESETVGPSSGFVWVNGTKTTLSSDFAGKLLDVGGRAGGMEALLAFATGSF